MRRDWLGRVLAALMGIWVGGMIVTPVASRESVPVDLVRARRTLPDRTRVVSAREASPESEGMPPVRTVARNSSPACGAGDRRATDELPVASVVEFTRVVHEMRAQLATAPRRHRASAAHVFPPALGPPSPLV